MEGKRAIAATAIAAIVGALLAVAAVWASQPDPPPCATLDNGMRACMPVLVVPPPWWLSWVVAAIGAVLAGGVTHAVARRSRPRSATH